MKLLLVPLLFMMVTMFNGSVWADDSMVLRSLEGDIDKEPEPYVLEIPNPPMWVSICLQSMSMLNGIIQGVSIPTKKGSIITGFNGARTSLSRLTPVLILKMWPCVTFL